MMGVLIRLMVQIGIGFIFSLGPVMISKGGSSFWFSAWGWSLSLFGSALSSFGLISSSDPRFSSHQYFRGTNHPLLDFIEMVVIQILEL